MVALALCAWLITACGGAGTVSVPYPFSPGTSWTYRHTQDSQVGILTSVYRGVESYRGMVLHRGDQTTTLLPGLVTRSYFEWSGCPATRAIVAVDPTSQLEFLLDRSVGVTCGPVSVSGTAQVYLNGAFQGSVSWSASSSDGGHWQVTVPSGTYLTRRWNTALAIGTLYAQFAAAYVDRNKVTVLADGRDGSGASFRFEHMSGPVTSLGADPGSGVQGGPLPLLVLLLPSRERGPEHRADAIEHALQASKDAASRKRGVEVE